MHSARIRALDLYLPLLAAISIAFPASAQVPINDEARGKQETNTAVCMQRARTFKQSSVAPSKGVTTSVTTKGDLAGIQQVNGALIFGSPLSGTSVGNADLSILLAVGQSVQALKTKNVGQVVSALATVAATISANSSTLNRQQNAIGTANSLQGAFDQNTAVRLSGAQIWNQAIQAVTTRVQIRNQRLVDQAAAESAATKVMTYDPGSVSFVGGQ
jgi:hypothetical protein